MSVKYWNAPFPAEMFCQVLHSAIPKPKFLLMPNFFMIHKKPRAKRVGDHEKEKKNGKRSKFPGGASV